MPDVQIVNSQTQDGASAYVLPGTVELILKAVSAEFADNGAAGDWLPAVTVYSDSGHVIARAVDTAVVVTAGDDADVSWFPGVKHSAAGTASGVEPWAFGEATVPLAGSNATFATFVTSDATVYALNGSSTGLVLGAIGFYKVYYGASWAVGGANPLVTDRIQLTFGVAFTGGGTSGSSTQPVLNNRELAGHVATIGAQKIWTPDGMDVVNVKAGGAPATLAWGANTNSATHPSGDLEVYVERVDPVPNAGSLV